jgi:hypothetical protein
MKTILLTCGILSSLLYILMNIFIPLQFAGYSYSAHTVSELSAIGAPTRQVWIWLAFAYVSLFAAFAFAVWKSVDGNRFLRIAAILMFVYSVVNFYWPPMHARGTEATLTDTLHIAWAMVTVLLMMFIIGFGAAALGKSFRLYTVVSIIAHFGFGILTSLEAPNIPTNGPTPWIGVWERINIAVFMAWIVVLAIALLRRNARSRAELKIDKFAIRV